MRIRLTRVGKKNSPAYRVVVADHRKAVKRKSIEILGHYNPTTNPKDLVINKERSLYWISQGAQASDTVQNLMCDLGILPKKDKVKKVYAKAPEKKAKEGDETEKVAPAVEETVTEVLAEETPSEVEPVVIAEEVAETEPQIEAPVETEPVVVEEIKKAE